MYSVGTYFYNTKDELCMIASITESHIYIELLDYDGEVYKIKKESFPKLINTNKYKLTVNTKLGKLIYV